MKSIRRRDIWVPPVPTREKMIRVFLPGESPYPTAAAKPAENVYPGDNASNTKLFHYWHARACELRTVEDSKLALEKSNEYFEKMMKDIEGL